MVKRQQESIAEICSKLNPDHVSLEWLDVIQNYTNFYLGIDPNRKSASLLKKANTHAQYAKMALVDNNTEAAVFSTIGAMQCAWHAEILEGRTMIDSGVTSYRAAERSRWDQKEKSVAKKQEWQRLADQIRLESPDKGENKGWVAGQVAERVMPLSLTRTPEQLKVSPSRI